MFKVPNCAAWAALCLLAIITRAYSAEPPVAVPAITPPPKAENVELPQADADGWISIFDGKSFTGWYGDPKVWRVVDGCISGKASRVDGNTFLIYNHPFSNFILEAKGMLIKGKGFTNSGIQYRSTVTNPEKWVLHGYQFDMGEGRWGANYQEGMRGSLWEASEAAIKATRLFDEWNQIRITCNGSKIKHEINGVVCGELDDKDPVKRETSGIIALQYHAPGMDFEVRFKDIRIKILPDSK